MTRLGALAFAAFLFTGCASGVESSGGPSSATASSTATEPTPSAPPSATPSTVASTLPSPKASSAPVSADKDHFEVIATLVDKGPQLPGCGILMVWGTFRYEAGPGPDAPGSRADMLVLVPCPDMPRKMYSADAGNVETFTVGDRHRLLVHKATEDERKRLGNGRKEPLFVADRIDRAS